MQVKDLLVTGDVKILGNLYSKNGIGSSGGASGDSGSLSSALSNHINNTANPHGVSCSIIGAATSTHAHSNYAASDHNHDTTYAAKSHGYHVPMIQPANNAKFLRNDNTWQTVTPANIGAALATDLATANTNINSLSSNKMDKANPRGTGNFALNTTNVGDYSVVVGSGCTCPAVNSLVFGLNSTVDLDCGYSIAGGGGCRVKGMASQAFGFQTIAKGN
jgi:hypothetical protein